MQELHSHINRATLFRVEIFFATVVYEEETLFPPERTIHFLAI